MRNKKMSSLMRGAWILSLGGLIAKILSAVYRVPFQNMVGDTGFYAYQQIYPLYGIGMTFALSGFPVYISKQVAQARDPFAQAEVTHRALVLMTGIGLVMFAALELGADLIAQAMADAGLAPIIRSVGLMFLTMPLLSAARGYFQGTFDMSKTAISQVVEQLLRVGVILLAAAIAVHRQWDPYKMASWAMTGAFVGGLGATLVILPAYRKKVKGQGTPRTSLSAYAKLLERFAKEGGSIALFAALLILLQLVDSFTVTRGLIAQGLAPAAARALKGVYDRGQPLVQLGLVVATALSTTLLPSLSRSVARGHWAAFQQTARQLIRFNFGLSLAAAAGLIALMPSVNRLLFGDTVLTGTLRMYTLCIILVALINAYNAVLQSLNRFRYTSYALGAGVVVKLVVNEWLTVHYGAFGAASGTVLSLLVITGLLYLQLPRNLQGLDPRRFNLRLMVVVGVMSEAVHQVAAHMPTVSRVDTLRVFVVCVPLGVLLFVVVGALCRLYTVREVLAIPYGRRFMKWWQHHFGKE
ncbi:oligosaccharide flippase family protein [Lacticaseibacillus jixianensis]|uniref:Oligosaccharide flippase family protein n=1 Tax=Lacticaseibacillus jixianensis TaxID=2486012 RepID=A0ABW4B7Q3_9LACO|nr:polysaccharide biosynthesis protein [Lacticaseibacillus jixianensis]